MDLKLVGYGVSSVSVALLGAAAWPGQEGARPAFLIAGTGASVIGMGIRYASHRREQEAIAFAQLEAERAKDR